MFYMNLDLYYIRGEYVNRYTLSFYKTMDTLINVLVCVCGGGGGVVG